MFQGHSIGALEEDAQLGMFQRSRRRQLQRVLLPVGRRDVKHFLHQFLTLIHRLFVDELYTDGTIALQSLGPNRETIRLPLLDANAEIALVDQSRATVLMTWGGENNIVGTTLEGAVVTDVDTAKGLPAHQMLGKLERAVLDQLAIESTVGSIVDVLKEDAIHRRLYGCTKLPGVDV